MSSSTRMIHRNPPVIPKDSLICINVSVGGRGDKERGEVCPTGVSHV